MIDTLEQSLNGGYAGLYGEVVTCDCYRLKEVEFVPDVIFDVGANVGVFTRFARSLWPEARIISVEPDSANCEVFRHFTQDENIVLLEKALGYGEIFHGTTAANGAGETYLSEGLGYPALGLKNASDLNVAKIKSLTLSQLIMPHARGKTLAKIDCEGAENCIWRHEPSMDALRSLDYIAMELHDYALTHDEREIVLSETVAALKTLEPTHVCERAGVHFWAMKKA